MSISIPRHKDSLKFSRSELPQIRSDHVSDFLTHLHKQGISHKRHDVDPSKLRATQNEFNHEKVKGMMAKKDLSIKPSLTSKDGYILDGHHRWLVDHNKGQKHHTVTVDLPIKDLIHRAHSYGKSFTKSITEQRLEIIRGTITEAAKKVNNAYGWFNDKGTFFSNRGGIHGKNYKQKAKHLTISDKRMLDSTGYGHVIDHALRHKWVRADLSPETRHDTKERALYGVLQHKKGAWTDRHEKNLKRVKKAIGLPHDAPDDVTRIEESTTHGWIDPDGKWHGTTPTLKLHYDVYMKHLLKNKPADYEKLKATAKSNWRQGNGIAIQHAKRHGWLHTYIDDDGYGMIAGKKSQFDKHRKVIDGIKQKYSKHDVTHVYESHE